MPTIIVLFNLKPGVNAADYEHWARSVDLPTVTRLPSVREFSVLRSTALFGSDAPPPFRYVERLEVTSVDALVADIGSAAMQKVATEFAGFADAPQFMLCEPLA